MLFHGNHVASHVPHADDPSLRPVAEARSNQLVAQSALAQNEYEMSIFHRIAIHSIMACAINAASLFPY
eukprot:CAMPEP_0119570572 /NCGR_PEP_ID=MMETSP1352-20130426/43683_1 /TAXON_ID=265584 /ORGANISM="Stauroneis constricta, Strain CCMP1120" /LENGTH=68 /DNA_ID=CAMNT_0007620241 /DNA_START=445 /DNA_END=651 /DNA_ORIENTATION=+